MKNILKTIFIISIVSSVFLSCETFDLEQTKSPSQLGEEFIDPVYTFNYIQLQLPQFIESGNEFTQEIIRQRPMTGGTNYNSAYAPVNFSSNWSDGYNILNAIKIMEPYAVEKNANYILGASKAIRVYVLLNLVDTYGDIPYSEALLGNQNLTPKYDKSSDIYRSLLVELDDAISVLNLPNNDKIPTLDLYYGGKESWVTLCNTLKLKLLCTARLAGSDIGIADIGSSIKEIVDQGNFINEISEDFEFKYGNSRNTPNTRHPEYNRQYELNASSYQSNYFMWVISEEKNIDNIFVSDPRENFYFHRQGSAGGQPEFILPNRTRPNHYDESKYNSFFDSSLRTAFTVSNWTGQANLPSGGFWGRDHGNAAGIPPDTSLRTVQGVYPIGGIYKITASDVQNEGVDGAQGKGITPMILSSFVHFMLAEAYLTLPTASASGLADAKAEFLIGINQSIDKVINFNSDYTKFTPSQLNTFQSQKDNYLQKVTFFYDGLNNERKLELIIKEFYIAAFGNGIESYNAYRRTGYPSNLQPTLESVSGTFYNCAWYPSNAVANNPNAPSNNRERKVFWHKLTTILN